MPNLGDVIVNISSEHFVIVRVFKFDTIRQEAYWVTEAKLCRECKSRIQAEEYKARIEKGN